MTIFKQHLLSIVLAFASLLPATGTAARIDIKTNVDAKISADFKPLATGTTASWLDVPLGVVHILKAEATGYRPVYQEVTLQNPEDRVPIKLHLEPLTVPILIKANVTASVSCDGTSWGMTPILRTDLIPGTYELTLTAPGYQKASINLDLRDGKSQIQDVTLTSNSGVLNITSSPAGATVYINGRIGAPTRGNPSDTERWLRDTETVTTTPLTISNMPLGDLRLELKLDGYKPFTQIIKLKAGDTANISPTLEPLDGTLMIESVPKSGAKVFINDVPSGATPLRPRNLPAGIYTLRLEAPGYITQTRTITLSPNDNRVETFNLLSDAGTLVVTLSPSTATAQSKGQKLSFLPNSTSENTNPDSRQLNLPTGTHTILFSAKGYHDKAMTVVIERGGVQTLQVALEKRFIPDLELTMNDGSLIKGRLIEKMGDGGYKLEVRPGMILVYTRAHFKSFRPILDEETE